MKQFLTKKERINGKAADFLIIFRWILSVLLYRSFIPDPFGCSNSRSISGVFDPGYNGCFWKSARWIWVWACRFLFIMDTAHYCYVFSL